eukprot:TRINITY_DN4850_c0_g1_i1.p2 TRINITY_DN4850_c0_g1~~TRINITY_DN4850_c0_g1_i1.p2  ORF type:complete len:240 (+),score=37.58 TRINITY_DN4850_c0_g1_i1:77-721(+)
MICTSMIQAFDQYKQVVVDATVEVCLFSLVGADSCVGDSGGPVVLADESEDPSKDIIVGITSWGPNKECDGSSNSPGVYTKVSAFLDWIQVQMDSIQMEVPNGQQVGGSMPISTSIGLQTPPITPTGPLTPPPVPGSPQEKVRSPRFPNGQTPAAVPEQCQLPAERGPCEGNILSYYYDVGQGVCTSFMWGGCGGNANNFVEKVDCEEACLGTR